MEDHFSQLISSGQCFHFNHIVFAGRLLPNPPFHNFEVLLVLWGMLLKEGSLGTSYLGAEDGQTCSDPLTAGEHRSGAAVQEGCWHQSGKQGIRILESSVLKGVLSEENGSLGTWKDPS